MLHSLSQACYLSLSLCIYLIAVSPGHWDSMEEYTCMIPRDTHDGAFYRAVLALHQDLFSLAQQVSYIIAHKYTQWIIFPPSPCTLKVFFFFSKDVIKTLHMGICLASRLLEFLLVFTVRYEKLKSLETNTVKKKKTLRLFQSGLSSRISTGFLLKEIKCSEFCFSFTMW